MTVAIHQIAGLSPAEAALYAAEHAPRGAAVDVPLAAGERLEIRLGLRIGRRLDLDVSRLFVVEDEDGSISAAPAAGRHLVVKLRQLGHGVVDAAPLALNLPTDVALIVEAAGGAVLLSEHHDDGRRIVIEAAGDEPAGDEPARPAKSKASATLNTLSYLASNSWRP